ncbi:serine-rich adhesin for platelets [Halyomorpha halys]|uniref:serine-rich adhesin for platelets n=1 Tax=Halyomorpha halys TaxID=286706 RepID=UPI0006D50CA5|nr:titin homolog [Halyomorpha halys]
MESLLPSEIARLVYGYLIEENCEGAAQLLLETSSSLKECLTLQKKGRKFNTTVLGLSLVDILNLYTDAVCLVKNYLARADSLNHALSEFVKELGNVLVIDHDSGHNISKTVFLRISVPNKKKARRSSVHLESIEEEDEEDDDEEKKKKEKENQQNEQKKSSVSEESVPAKNNATSSNDDFDLNILQTLLDNTALHERLAENINKAIDSSGETSNHKTDEKKIIETILHNTEADPIFHELLDELVAPRTEDTTTPEDTDKENGDPAEERQAPNLDCGHTTNEDPETSKKIEEQSNLAIEGILAGNKKVQDEKVNEEPQPTETIVISTPQAIATSSGIYKQSFIIPAGYTVTDVFPTTQISTPLQPLHRTNLPTFGHLTPILPLAPGVTRQTVSIRGGLQTRRKRILPKSETETFYINVPTQDDQIQEVKVEIPNNQNNRLPEGIKGSRVRTRGGVQKVYTRGVKAIVPQVAKPVDSNIQVIISPETVKKTNISGIKTRAMAKRQEKDKKLPIKPPVTAVVQPLSNEEPQQAEFSTEKDSLPEKSKEIPKEDVTNDVAGATPQQQTIPKHPRVSLSTPRRTHVRVLDFETPEKNLTLRKSMTSPKVYHHKKEPKSLDFIKRGGMFSSPPKDNPPPKEIPKEDDNPQQKKEGSKIKKGWDSDLRNFMGSRENLDIPTSVGLKRKAGAKRDKCSNAKRKVTRKKVTKKLPEKKNSNEELVDQIEKEVRDVIGEDEMGLNTSHNSELGNLIEQKLLEEMEKNDLSSSLEIVENPPSEASKSPDISKETPPEEVMIDVGRKDDVQKSSEPQVSNNEDCTNDAEKHDDATLCGGFNTSTPLKLAMSPINENSRGQLTPTTKLVMSHLGKVNTRYPSVFSPTSQSSLENILIKECSRMETEKNASTLAQDIEKLSSPKSGSSKNTTSEDKAPESKKDTPSLTEKELTFESVCKNSVHLFQTPAKFLSAPIPPGTPVEMTPLTKVLTSETSFAATVLVTPTIPPTPKNTSFVTPQKTDESSTASINLSGKDTDKPQEEDIVRSLNTNQEKPMNQENFENCPLESNISVNKPPDLVMDPLKNINNDHIEQNKDLIDEAPTTSDTKTVSSTVTEKQTCTTPKIKLMSPKLNKTNEPLVRKKTGKIVELRKSSEGNASKQTKGVPKSHSDNSFDGKDAEQVIIDLESSNQSEQSDINKSSEGIVNKKQAPQETKKQTSRKKVCLEKNNKSLKKSPKQNIAKPAKKSSVDEEMESEIRHLLKDTKAKLFGPDNSSDSDSASESSMDCDLELKQSNVQLKTARERLQKLDNISMLNSSSTSDESSDNETPVKPKISEKDSKDGVFVKKSEHSYEEEGLECNSILIKHSEGLNPKKADGISSSKLIESSKVISREIEESCESFPTLHLSEESNQSLKLDNNSTKCQKSRKSPLSGSDVAGAKSSSLLITTSSTRANERAKSTKDPRTISSNTPCKIEVQSSKTKGQSDLNVKPKKDDGSYIKERVFHIYSKTAKSKISDSEEKSYLARSQVTSQYLDSYVYSFTLDVDKAGDYLNKELRSSPFFHVFDLPETQPIISLHTRKDERKIETPRTELRIRPRSKSRNRKRNRSASGSEDEREKRDYNRSYGSYRGERIRGRDRDRDFRYRSSYDRREFFLRKKYRDMRSHDSRYRDFDHYSPYDKKRLRHDSPEPRRSSKKEDRRALEDKIQPGKYKMYSNINDSFTSSKSGSEGDGKHTDMSRSYSPERSSGPQKERCSTSSQRLVVDDQPPSRSRSRTSKLSVDTEREDGELSDSSEVKRVSQEGSRSALLSLEAHDSRATLLNKVDLDQFLSIVHGEED